MTAAATTTQEASLAALYLAGNRNVGIMNTNAPARCPFFLLLFLWTRKEKVDKRRKEK